ncbi:hypothetical protein [Aquamicrobium sp.]|uniref:hypothetical protein n=1 Tax=Aquamicrobium sp. TaxID=1872579 RepID=UPI00258BFA07|nr:hypothetical protein [Aquamicrobium sp.]MCK9550278.1 hypothetical protein [Aquamicrobium sp.]
MVINTLRAVWLRYTISRQEARRDDAVCEARHHRQRARDAAAKRRDAQTHIDDAERELAGIERRATVRRIERARPC